jgi:hypothetical protein
MRWPGHHGLILVVLDGCAGGGLLALRSCYPTHLIQLALQHGLHLRSCCLGILKLEVVELLVACLFFYRGALRFLGGL